MALSSATGNGSADIAKRWRELHGEHSWKGLLEPLDMDLRKSIISYGELAEATYDGFNNEKHSPHYGFCKYGYDDLLTRSGAAAASHYKVTRFVYTWENNVPTWVGYVAVATDEGVAALGRRDVVVAWRGTVTGTEWIDDAMFLKKELWPALDLAKKSKSLDPKARVHSGFLSLYTAGGGIIAGDDVRGATREQVLEEVNRLMELYNNGETSVSITVVGHSLGSAFAILNAIDLVANGVNRSCPVTAMVFACPHVGNKHFNDAFDSFEDLRALHVRNKKDLVPELPLLLPDLGVQLRIDTSLSSYLKKPCSCASKLKNAHDLQCYLHGVAGEVGSDGKFRLLVDRDVALVNKSADALKDKYYVPASWWVAQYMSMVKNEQGKWELKDFEQY